MVRAVGKKCAKAARSCSAALCSISGSILESLTLILKVHDAIEILRIADAGLARRPQTPRFLRDRRAGLHAVEQRHRPSHVLAHELHGEARVELAVEDP